LNQAQDRGPRILMTKDKVLELLESMGAKPLKSLGQNFLIDEQVISRIVNYEKIDHSKEFYEIGPGLGSLTKALYNFHGLMPKLIELDKSFSNYWVDEGYEVYHQDALKFDWSSVSKSSVLISNLPYQISSRLILDLFVKNPPFDQMILMFQKEVGQRLRAYPEDKKIYGLTSVVAQLNWSMNVVTNVSPFAFFPKPEIESQVLFFSKKEEPVSERREFLDHLKKVFHSRRKKMKSALKGLTGCDEILDKRPDALTPSEHLDLFKKTL